MAEIREDAEPLPDLPPLAEGDEPDPQGDFSELLQAFEDEGDLDDSTAEDLDAGIDLDDDAALGGDDGATPLDVGEVVDDGDELDDEECASFDDALGPASDGTTPFDDDESPELDGDDAEGTIEPSDPIPEELPGLFAQTGDDQEGGIAEETDDLLGMGEEEEPLRAERPWLELPAPDAADCRVVHAVRGSVVAGGTGIVLVDPEGAARTVVDDFGEPVIGLLVGPDGDTLLAATAEGKLYRLSLAGGPVEEMSSFSGALSHDDRVQLSLGGPTQGAAPATLLRVSTGGGALFQSTDQGSTFSRVELGARILSLGAGLPPVCLIETEEGPQLVRSVPGEGFVRIGGALAIDEHARLASDGDVVAVLEPGLGVRVSADGATTMRRAAGTSRATAVIAGRLGGRPSAFAALFDTPSGRTALVWIDAASAEARVVSELSQDLDQDDDTDDWAKVLSLSWDAEEETLWAAGAFGVRGFRRPPSA